MLLVGVHQKNGVVDDDSDEHDDAEQDEDVHALSGQVERPEDADQAKRQRRHDQDRLNDRFQDGGEDKVRQHDGDDRRFEKRVRRFLHEFVVSHEPV